MSSTRITGYLRNTSYLHVTQEAKDNLTTVMRGQVVTSCPNDDGSAPDAFPIVYRDVPIVPSNSIRGKLRRHTLSILVEALLERGEFINKDTYQMLSNGGKIGGKNSGKVTVGEMVRARKNVFFGIWGGGPRLVPSAVVTCDLMPVCRETMMAGLVPLELQGFAPHISQKVGDGYVTEPASARQLLGRRMFKKMDEMMDLNDDAMKRLSVLGENMTEIVNFHQIEQIGFREDRRSMKEDKAEQDKLNAAEWRGKSTQTAEEKEAMKKKDLTNFLEMEIVAAGLVWPIDMRLDKHATAAQIALFARGLESFANEQRLGSFGRLGFGQYEISLTIEHEGEVIGTIAYDKQKRTHHLVFSTPGYDEALALALQEVSADDLNSFAIANPITKAPKNEPKVKVSKTAKSDAMPISAD